MKPVTEDELKASATAPRVTKEGLEANIKAYYTFNVLEALEALNEKNPGHQMPLLPELGVLTFAVMVLNNGYTVTGQSACADPANYNAEIGGRLAIEDAKRAIWPLMGYALKEELHLNGGGTFVDRMEREAQELSSKLSKAEAFSETDTFLALDIEEQRLQHAQRKAMADYLDVLKRRLARQGK